MNLVAATCAALGNMAMVSYSKDGGTQVLRLHAESEEDAAEWAYAILHTEGHHSEGSSKVDRGLPALSSRPLTTSSSLLAHHV